MEVGFNKHEIPKVRQRVLCVRLRGRLIVSLAGGVARSFPPEGGKGAMRIVSAFKHADVASLVVYCASNAVKKYVEERHKWPALWENLESISTTTDTDLVPPGGWGLNVNLCGNQLQSDTR